MEVAVAALNPTPAGVTLSLIHPNHGISPPLRDEDHLTSKWLEQVFCLPGDSRDGYPNLFDSHSLAFTILETGTGLSVWRRRITDERRHHQGREPS